MTLSPATALEATMLICFGFSWPIANLRMLRTRRAEGRGIVPTMLTLLGYSAGLAAKVVCACTGAGLAAIFWLYLLNAASVALNLGLQRYFAARPGGPLPFEAEVRQAARWLIAVPRAGPRAAARTA